MKHIVMGAVLALAVCLGGCSTVESLVQGTTASTPAQANSVAQAELAYTAVENALHLYLTTKPPSAAVAKQIGEYNTAVYNALVAVRTPTTLDTILSTVKEDLPTAIKVITALVPILVPGGAVIVGGLTVASALGIANGVANEVPDLVNIWNEMQALANAGTAPTAEQWTAWNAAADAAYQQVQADLKKIEDGGT